MRSNIFASEFEQGLTANAVDGRVKLKLETDIDIAKAIDLVEEFSARYTMTVTGMEEDLSMTDSLLFEVLKQSAELPADRWLNILKTERPEEKNVV